MQMFELKHKEKAHTASANESPDYAARMPSEK